MPRGERFYYRHKAQVVDGTRCNDESIDVCVQGKCQVRYHLMCLTNMTDYVAGRLRYDVGFHCQRGSLQEMRR